MIWKGKEKGCYDMILFRDPERSTQEQEDRSCILNSSQTTNTMEKLLTSCFCYFWSVWSVGRSIYFIFLLLRSFLPFTPTVCVRQEAIKSCWQVEQIRQVQKWMMEILVNQLNIMLFDNNGQKEVFWPIVEWMLNWSLPFFSFQSIPFINN